VPSHWPESLKCDNADPTIDSTSAGVGFELPAADWQKSSKINKPTSFLITMSPPVPGFLARLEYVLM